MIGTKLAHYEITSHIGSGGMGEVYQATDTKLGRSVAIKFLPEAFSHDTERVARFQREARVLASLNHSNIAAIHGVEQIDTSHFLVMELVPGETLAERIKRGAIPIEEALPIAKQICEALEAAHEQGIVHRDLKPGNIKITPDGKVKVLDFGLAKAMESGAAATLSNSPTLLSVAASNAGVILGTAGYMSPEQAKGKSVDKRADIWAFGVVLYEMLTGKMAFSGETVSETMAFVMTREPDWKALPANTPWRLQRLLRRCLNKDPRNRLQAIGEARIGIEEVQNGSATTSLISPTFSQRGTRLWMYIAVVVTIIAAAMAVPATRYFRIVSPATPPEIRLEVTTPPTSDPSSFAISPDGRNLVFVAPSEGRPHLWLRPLASAAAQPLARTDDASFPFWSPDSRSIGFMSQDKIKSIDIGSGTVQVITTAAIARGATWSSDGTILFGITAGPIFRVSASGGAAVPLTKLKRPEETYHGFPYFLPDGRHFLFGAAASGGSGIVHLYATSVDGSEPRLLFDADSPSVFAKSGYLLFKRQGTLFAQRFDSKNLQVIGGPITLATDIGRSPAAVGFSASDTGVVVYRAAAGAPLGATAQYVWFDRAGKQLGTVGQPGMGSNPVLSTDGRRLAMQSGASGNSDIWLFDMARNLPTRFTFDPAGEYNPIWSPDGSRIVFGSTRKGLGLVVKPASGVGAEELLLESQSGRGLIAQDSSRDSRFILYLKLDEKGGSADIWALPLTGERKPFPVVETNFTERDGQFSPNVKWVAYASDETGQSQIYIQPFPMATGKWQISTNGGFQPRWRPDGKELFYLDGAGELMAVPIQFAASGQSIEPGSPVSLFTTRIPGGVQQSLLNRQQYVVSPDGQRFLIRTETQEPATLPITILLNWKLPDS